MSTVEKRVAIVTGGGRGIGAETSARLAADGFAVAVLDRDGDKAEEVAGKIGADGGTALAVTADVSSKTDVEAAVRQVADGLGAPTVLVNNAGVTRDKPFEDITDDDWDVVMNVNLRGPFLMCRAVRPFQREAHYGRIVNVSSIAYLGTRNQSNYCAAKAGLLGLTRALSIELGPEGITVNAVAPGYIVSDLTTTAAAQLGVKFENVTKVVAAQTPVRRVGEPEDIANTIAYLVDERSGFVTGQTVVIAGGLMG
jgi:3-oxoacyl-[acyl-carrier protein] reductase